MHAAARHRVSRLYSWTKLMTQLFVGPGQCVNVYATRDAFKWFAYHASSNLPIKWHSKPTSLTSTLLDTQYSFAIHASCKLSSRWFFFRSIQKLFYAFQFFSLIIWLQLKTIVSPQHHLLFQQWKWEEIERDNNCCYLNTSTPLNSFAFAIGIVWLWPTNGWLRLPHYWIYYRIISSKYRYEFSYFFPFTPFTAMPLIFFFATNSSGRSGFWAGANEDVAARIERNERMAWR